MIPTTAVLPPQDVFTLPPLPYKFDALEPHIDAKTMEIHHDTHHAAYVKNLHAAVAKAPELKGKSVADLLAMAARVRLKLGDETAKSVLIGLLLSADRPTCELAIEGLRLKYSVQLGYDPADPLEDRRKSVEKWLRQ